MKSTLRLLFKQTIGRGPVTIALVLVILGSFLFMYGVAFMDIMELKTIDLRFEMRGAQPTGDEVVLAAIDEKSLKQEGRWVWPRTKIAELVTKLSEKGARVIAFDVGFFEPENPQVMDAIRDIQKNTGRYHIKNSAFERYLELLKAGSDNDRALARAIEAAEAEVVLGFFFQINPEDAGHIIEQELAVHQQNIQGARYNMVRYKSEAAKQTSLTEAAAPQSNITTISEVTEYDGFFNKLTDPDGVVRRLPMVIRFNEGLYAPLCLKAVSAYLDSPTMITLARESGVAEVRVGDLTIPTNGRGEIVINYRGAGHTFPHIPVTDILNDAVDETAVRDKIVVIGATAIGIHDECVTPLAKVFPGPEVHLNAIDSILAGDFLYHPAWAHLFDLIIIFAGGLLLAFALSRTRAVAGGVFMLLIFGGYIWLCYYFFSQMGWILNMVYPLSVFICIYVAVTSYKYLSEEGQKKFIREAFSKYLAPQVVNQLIESPQKLILGGERREITAFFSDVQGFTSISEKLSPEALVELLNEFLTEVTDIILQHQGAVDKFEGDAVIAFFGAPNDLDNHAEAACLACVGIQERMKALREKWKAEGKPELKVRIGLHSGPAVVGNMGSRNRMDYTMMGDTVNTAARLEGVNKIYGTYTLIGDPTYQASAGNIAARELDAVKVVGKAAPVPIYEILGTPGQIDESTTAAMGHYAAGLSEYRRQNWDAAVEWFTRVLEMIPDDGPSKTMIERCRIYKDNPPGDDWDGAYSMTTK
ncbi:MAG: adenylate/guanylate cyclase domain-containing protein [Thermodesulfobacteriota bacterium]|nr:adenylate/guanylate cyclase domain-containing protein [Thermodesulfobacteriota bacterium]